MSFKVKSSSQRIHSQSLPKIKRNGHKITKKHKGTKSNISYLKIFKSITYTNVPKQKRTKLDDKKVKLIFIICKSKFNKLFDPSNSRVVINKDVEFKEV